MKVFLFKFCFEFYIYEYTCISMFQNMKIFITCIWMMSITKQEIIKISEEIFSFSSVDRWCIFSTYKNVPINNRMNDNFTKCDFRYCITRYFLFFLLKSWTLKVKSDLQKYFCCSKCMHTENKRSIALIKALKEFDAQPVFIWPMQDTSI